MNYEHCKRYWEPAALNLVRAAWPLTVEHSLDKALGSTVYMDYVNRHAGNDYPLSEEWIILLQQLAEPHGNAILRAYQIKHGIAHEEASV